MHVCTFASLLVLQFTWTDVHECVHTCICLHSLSPLFVASSILPCLWSSNVDPPEWGMLLWYWNCVFRFWCWKSWLSTHLPSSSSKSSSSLTVSSMPSGTQRSVCDLVAFFNNTVMVCSVLLRTFMVFSACLHGVVIHTFLLFSTPIHGVQYLSLIHIWRCRRGP